MFKLKYKFLGFLLCLNSFYLYPTPGHTKDSKISSQVSDIRYLLQSGILQNLAAKEICSCTFVAKVPLEVCKSRANIPSVALRTLNIDVDENGKTISVALSIFGQFLANKGGEGGEDGDHYASQKFISASARYRSEAPQLGCQLTK